MNKEKTFEKIKDSLIEENEALYGNEIRDSYGDHVVDQSYLKFKKMTQADFNKSKLLEEEIIQHLIEAKALNDVSNVQAKELCMKHQTWIKMFWPTYNKEAHLALCKMYTEDERFKHYYDQHIEGAALFLYDAMKLYLQERK
jgi:hypothetical protein